MEELVVRIDRDYSPTSTTDLPLNKRFCPTTSRYTRFQPAYKSTLEKPRNSNISVAILRSNKLIYHEALPLLYHSVKFCPWSTTGTFPIFLSNLSAFAKQHIQHIKLYMDAHISPQQNFSWAITCAQIATLPCVREVEIESTHIHRSLPRGVAERLLWPLLKIRAVKRLTRGDDVFQALLLDAAQDLQAEQRARQARAEIRSAGTHKFSSLVKSDATGRFHPLPYVEELAIVNGNRQSAEDLTLVERESEEWEIIRFNTAESESETETGKEEELELRVPPPFHEPKPTGRAKRTRSDLDGDDNGDDGGGAMLPKSDDEWELIDI